MTRLPLMLDGERVGSAKVKATRDDGGLRFEVSEMKPDPGKEALFEALYGAGDLKGLSIIGERDARNLPRGARGTSGTVIENQALTCPECFMQGGAHAQHCHHHPRNW